MKKLTVTALAAMLLLGGSAFAGKQGDFQKAMKAAQEARKMAQSVDGEWRDIGKILKHAQKAAKKGDFETAIKLARVAEFQGKAGYAQAMAEKGVGNPAYLYN
ncbi:MAG TPA: SoxXA-binding protein [Chromatiaceae bacterium]|nr:SoxXA-binding protein [Chromatiaceae bacterium]